jgi:hypothetical protein
MKAGTKRPTIGERFVTEVCVFKGEKYGWYALPRPMVKAAADVWARTHLDMPVEDYRYSFDGETLP